MKTQVLPLLFLHLVTSYQHFENGYYWRDYFGTIPSDAFVAGTDKAGRNVYIGQGYYKNHGLKPGRITPGLKEMQVPWGHHNTLSSYNKVLCGRQENFYWMNADSTNLRKQIEGKRAVLGGYDDDPHGGDMCIGRINNGGNIKIGKVASFRTVDMLMYYIDGPYEKEVTNFEVLMYEERPVEIDARSGFA